MRGIANREELRKLAQRAFVQQAAPQRPADPRAVEEELRQMAGLAKTAGLRELRLARDAAAHKAAEAKPSRR
jgi:hypothetical protein